MSVLRSALANARRSPSATALVLLCGEAFVLLAVSAVAEAAGKQPYRFEPEILAASFALCAFCSWWFVARPFEAGLRASRRTLRSLFVENPESIAVYGLDGTIMRGNKAAADMMKQPPEVLIGAHYTTHVAPEFVGRAHEAFERAAAGGKVAIETVFIGADEQRIDVCSTLFPHVVDGEIVGVFGVAKDISELHRAVAAVREQTERIRELYDVSASSGRSWKEQIDDALRLACRRLDFAGAFLVEVVEDDVRSLAGSGDGFFAETVFGQAIAVPLDHQTLAVIAAGDDIVSGVRSGDGTRFVAAPLRFGPSSTGVLGLARRLPEACEIGTADRDFIRLLTALIAAALERGRQQERLDRLAFFDALTGLPNRVVVTDRLAELLSSAKWRGRSFAVHYVDLDRFKQVNDGFGHATGDQILRMAARRMQEAILPADMVARLGGDEFVIVQPLSESGDAEQLGLRILAAIAQPFCVEGISHQLGVSIGISISPNDGRDSQTLLKRADEALYRAKREGRNRLQFAVDHAGAVNASELETRAVTSERERPPVSHVA